MTTRLKGSLLALSAIAMLLVTSGCGGMRSEQYRQQGDTLLRLGNYEQALDAYRQAEEADPDNPEAKVGIGRVYAAQGEFEQALAMFDTALQLDTQLESAHRARVETLLAMDQPEDAIAAAEAYRELDPQQGGLLMAQALMRADQPAAAVEALEGLDTTGEENRSVLVAMAQAYTVSGDGAKALETAEQLLAAPGSAPVSAWITYVEAAHEAGAAEQALERVAAEYESRPDSKALGLARALATAYAGDVERAREQLTPYLEDGSEDPWANFVQGAILTAEQRFGEALAPLAVARRQLPSDFVVGDLIAEARSARPGVARVSEDDAGDDAEPVGGADWRTLWQRADLASLLARRDTFLEAGDEDAREALAMTAMFTFNPELAAELAEELPESSMVPGYVDRVAEQDIRGLLDYFEQWPEQDDADDEVLRLNAQGFAYAQAGARGRALEVFAEAMQRWPQYAVSLLNTAQVYRAAQMPEHAAAVLQRLIAENPLSRDAQFLLYTVLRQGDMPQEALTAAQATATLFPDSLEAAINLAQGFIDVNQPEQAERTLRRALEQFQDDPGLKAALAGVLLSMNQPDEAAVLLDELAQDEAAEERTRVYRLYGAALKEDWQEVVSIGSRIDNPAPPVQFLTAAAHVQMGAMEEARDALGDSVRESARGGALLYALGDESAEAPEEATELANALRENPNALGTFLFALGAQTARLYEPAYNALTQVENLTGVRDSGIGQMMLTCLAATPHLAEVDAKARAVVDTYEDDAAVWLSYANYHESNEADAAQREALERAAELASDNPIVWLMMGRFEEQQDDMAAAGDAYARLLELRPGDPVASNNRAYCLLVTDGSAEEALELANEATEFLPNNPHLLHTLGVAQMRVGDLDAAGENLGKALVQRPGDPTMLLDVGQLLIKRGERDRGLRHVQEALTLSEFLGVDFPRSAEARQIIEGSEGPGATA